MGVFYGMFFVGVLVIYLPYGELDFRTFLFLFVCPSRLLWIYRLLSVRRPWLIDGESTPRKIGAGYQY